MGRVLAARDRPTGREVAIKVLNPGATSAERERFRLEARLMAKLRHRHIMPVLQVIETASTSAYVMPLVEGESLRELLRREGRLPFDEVVRILLELAAGLGAAHQAGVLHRDVKPENIVLEGSTQEVLVMDFGIARPLDRGQPRLTLGGNLLGTPDYMSPEQAAGDAELGPASDIYAFGIVGFEMITGRLPLRGRDRGRHAGKTDNGGGTPCRVVPARLSGRPGGHHRPLPRQAPRRPLGRHGVRGRSAAADAGAGHWVGSAADPLDPGDPLGC